MESVSVVLVKKAAMEHEEQCWEFQMLLHYPRHSKSDYESMPGWKLDCLLNEHGLPVAGSVEQKREFTIGAFLWSR